jgi:hypothetical protein
VNRLRPGRFPARGFASAIIAAAVLAGLAVVAGVGFAATGSSGSAASEYQYGHKVVICHHTGSKSHPNVTISISQHALPAHLRHGDTVGPCQKTGPTVTTADEDHGKSKSHGKSNHHGASSTSTGSTTTSEPTQGHGNRHGQDNGHGHGH